MTASAKEVIAKTAGDYYDGYADPADTPENWSRGLGCANDILAALDAAGYVVVPREPTLPMQNAGWRVIDDQGFATEDTEVAPIYRAMIAAGDRDHG